VCHTDIQSGLTFNGTDLGCRGASELEETLKWQNNFPVIQSETLTNESPSLKEMNLPNEVIPEVKTEPSFDLSMDQSDISSNESVIVIGSICPVCSKQFASKNNCRRHVREMHNKTPVSQSRYSQNNNKEEVTEVLDTSETCPLCNSKVDSKMELRRHLVEEHSLTMIDACAVSEKEPPLSNTLPTLVGPSSVLTLMNADKVQASIPPSKRKVACPLCGVILYDKWTARKHLMGKFHSKTAEEADVLLSQALPSSRKPLPAVTSSVSKYAKNTTSNIKTEVLGKPEAKKSKEVVVKPAKQPLAKISIEPKAKIEADVTDPDKISCPICKKLWHKSNLRNHLFYGHHMKTGEVEQVLLKLKDPLAVNEPKEIERTPCPMCDRSFKHWYNARRHLREHHSINHDETVRIIRPPSEKKTTSN